MSRLKGIATLELDLSFSEDCVATQLLQLLMAGALAVGRIVVSFCLT